MEVQHFYALKLFILGLGLGFPYFICVTFFFKIAWATYGMQLRTRRACANETKEESLI